jgi:serine protease Do
MKDQDLYLKLDAYVKGRMSAAEKAEFEEHLNKDILLRKQLEEHTRLVNAMNLYSRRQSVLDKLNEIPLETPDAETQPAPAQIRRSLRKLWPMTAVAASVALLSIFGTLYMTQSIKSEQTTRFRELSLDVEKIKRSQKAIIADIAEKKTPPRYQGSGFLVSSDGYVVTSYHLVKGADSVYIENANFGGLKTTVVFSDPANDLSLLRIDSGQNFVNPRSIPFTINANEANLGEDVFTLGFPREDIVFGEGSISAATGFQQNPNSYQVSVPVNPGNSGGPLFNAKGDLVGIISGIQTETSGAAFAIKSSTLLEVIKNLQADTLQIPLMLPRQNSLRYLSKVDQVKKWREYVFSVRVYNNK